MEDNDSRIVEKKVTSEKVTELKRGGDRGGYFIYKIETKGFKLNNYFKNVSETGVIKVMTDARRGATRGMISMAG